MWELGRQIDLPRGHKALPPTVVIQVQRTRILEAMLIVTSEQGYAQASVSRVVAQGGVSRRSFYRIFSDREECMVAAYDEVAANAVLVTTNAVAAAGPVRFEEKLRAGLGALCSFLAEHPHAARACIVEALAAGSALRGRRVELIAQLTEIIDNELRDTLGDDRVGTLAARALVGGIHELIYDYIDGGRINELPELAHQIAGGQIVSLAAA